MTSCVLGKIQVRVALERDSSASTETCGTQAWSSCEDVVPRVECHPPVCIWTLCSKAFGVLRDTAQHSGLLTKGIHSEEERRVATEPFTNLALNCIWAFLSGKEGIRTCLVKKEDVFLHKLKKLSVSSKLLLQGCPMQTETERRFLPCLNVGHFCR